MYGVPGRKFEPSRGSARRGSTIVKPRIDVRGLAVLSLRTVASDQQLLAGWADLELVGFEGDAFRTIERGKAGGPGPRLGPVQSRE